MASSAVWPRSETIPMCPSSSPADSRRSTSAATLSGTDDALGAVTSADGAVGEGRREGLGVELEPLDLVRERVHPRRVCASAGAGAPSTAEHLRGRLPVRPEGLTGIVEGDEPFPLGEAGDEHPGLVLEVLRLVHDDHVPAPLTEVGGAQEQLSPWLLPLDDRARGRAPAPSTIPSRGRSPSAHPRPIPRAGRRATSAAER